MLSVLIPSYNDEKNLPVALASALQVKSVSEIIVVDDNSSDNTQKLIEDFSSERSRIKYFKNKKYLLTSKARTLLTSNKHCSKISLTLIII